MTLTELIERLEKADAGSRELDAAIRFVVAGDMTRCNFDEGCYHGDCVSPGCGEWLGIHDERKSYPIDWRDDERLPRYTESLDAALTLVPEGWSPLEMHWHDGHCDACVYRYVSGRGKEVWHTWGETAALAMTTAALKARAGKDTA